MAAAPPPYTPLTPHTPHASQRAVAVGTTGELMAELTREAAVWCAREAREVAALAVHDGAVAGRWVMTGARRASYGAAFAWFTALRVPSGLLHAFSMSPGRRPWYAVYPNNYPRPHEWLFKLGEGDTRDDVFTSTPLVGAFALGRTLPRTATPEGWWEPLRRAWVGVHTRPVWVPPYRRYCHLLILGGPGTGKTSRWVIPGLLRDLLDSDGQILSVDAKGGEQYRLLYAASRRAGVRAICLDPWATRYTAAVEPLGSATPAQLEVLADALYDGTATRGGNDEFWDAYARSYLRFLLTLVALFPRPSRAVPCVAWLATEETTRVTELAEAILRQHRDAAEDMVQQAAAAALVLAQTDDATIADVHGRSDAVTDALATVAFLPHAVLNAVRALRELVACGGTVTRGHATQVAAVARDALREHYERLVAARHMVRDLERSGNERMAGSTRATLAARLRAFTVPEVSRFFARPEVNLWEFAEARERQLLCVGNRAGQGAASAQVTALVVGLALRSVYTRNELPDGDPVKSRPVWVYLDEVAQLQLPALPQHLALVRSMNCGLVLAAQDLSQLRVLYGELATAVESSCATVIALDRLEDATAERYAKRLGRVEIRRHVPSTAPGRRFDIRDDIRDRIEPADLRVRRINGQLRRDAVLQAGGTPHWLARPAQFFEDPAMRAELGLVRSGDRWTPSELPSCEREMDDSATWGALRDPHAETVLELVGTPPGALRPALPIPKVPWRAFGLDPDGGGEHSQSLPLGSPPGPGARLLPRG